MKQYRKKEAEEKYSVLQQLRITKQMDELLKAKALEKHTTESEIVRQAISNYINRAMSDTEIVHASLMENTRKTRYLENKVELLALVIFEQTKLIMKSLPSRPNVTDSLIQHDFEKFKNNCTKILKSNHTGVLEAMILDSYEQQGSDS